MRRTHRKQPKRHQITSEFTKNREASKGERRKGNGYERPRVGVVTGPGCGQEGWQREEGASVELVDTIQKGIQFDGIRFGFRERANPHAMHHIANTMWEFIPIVIH